MKEGRKEERGREGRERKERKREGGRQEGQKEGKKEGTVETEGVNLTWEDDTRVAAVLQVSKLSIITALPSNS